MRLIDADKIESVDFSECTDLMEIMNVIDAQPTAYDVDVVVEQLEELTEEECTLHECGIRSERCKPCIAKKAIEIVRGGGNNELFN